VGGGSAVLEVAGGVGESLEGASSADEGDAASVGEVAEDFDHGADVGAAEHGDGLGGVEVADAGHRP
jgi:hypothetical protein